MIILELDRQACLEILSESRVGRLAMCDGGRPYIVPMSCAMEGGALFGFTLPGRKLDLMRANGRVAMLFERHDGGGAWMSVLAEGRFTELPDRIGSKREREQAIQVLMRRPDWWRPGALKPMYPASTDNRDHVFFRIDIDSLSGRSSSAMADGSDGPISEP